MKIVIKENQLGILPPHSRVVRTKILFFTFNRYYIKYSFVSNYLWLRVIKHQYDKINKWCTDDYNSMLVIPKPVKATRRIIGN